MCPWMRERRRLRQFSRSAKTSFCCSWLRRAVGGVPVVLDDEEPSGGMPAPARRGPIEDAGEHCGSEWQIRARATAPRGARSCGDLLTASRTWAHRTVVPERLGRMHAVQCSRFRGYLDKRFWQDINIPYPPVS